MNPGTRPPSSVLVRPHTKQPQSDVAEARAKHGGGAFDMQSVAAILILVVHQVPDHLRLVLRRQDLVYAAADVAGDDHPWHQEHGAAVVAGPVAIVLLQVLKEIDAVADCGPHSLLWDRPPLRQLGFLHGRLALAACQALQPQQLIRAVVVLMPIRCILPPEPLHILTLRRRAVVLPEHPHLPALIAVERAESGDAAITGSLQAPHPGRGRWITVNETPCSCAPLQIDLLFEVRK
mmetsp:Transcript_7499/g.13515  ORF Transcript_7499/g.13515 Transcript_7499/m.13515 type:complete len:235 (+) Transcript_7499:874-1578(+)